MAKAKAQQLNYEALKAELDAVLEALQSDDLNVDQAVQQYERGLELVQQLKTYLKTAENKVTTLKAKFDASTS